MTVRGRRSLVVAAVLVAAAVSATCGATASARSGRVMPGGFSPQAVQRAYGVSRLLRKGIDGRGETVVLPETIVPPVGAGDSNIHQSLAAFDKRYHLPPVKLTITRLVGYTANPAMAMFEEVMDAEAVHTIAPGATIAVMLVPIRRVQPSGLGGLGALMRAAAQRGNVVSYSYPECGCLSAGQRASLNRALRYARDRHVSIFASSGDTGVLGWGLRYGVMAPGDNPLITGVGGTTLAAGRDGAYSETAWGEDLDHPTSTGARLSASGGGISTRYRRPGYQHGLPAIGDHRGVPDVAAMSTPGMTMVIAKNGHVGSTPGGGTSLSSPLWAGIAALADQEAHRQLGFLNDGLYRIGHSAMYHRAFHDITTGSNTVTMPSGKQITGYSASPGWDPVTGWGSPDAQVLVPLLGKEVHPDDGRGL